VDGTKHYIDHDINSIQNFLTEDTQNGYQMIDVNVYQENIFHTKMLLKEFDINNYLFGAGSDEFDDKELADIRERLQTEMLEIFYSRNM
jgi:S-adenosylmethionine decarboxylase